MFWDRLGVITDEVSIDFLEALDWISHNGLKHVEIRMVDGINVMELDDDKMDRVFQEVQRRGLFISAISSPIFKCHLDPTRPTAIGDQFGNRAQTVEAHYDMLHKAIQMAKKWGTTYIRIFSFWREQEPEQYLGEIITHLRQAAAMAMAEGIILLLENEHACNGGYAKEVACMVHEVNSTALKVLWDPGNEERWSSSFPEGYGYVRDLYVHFHLKHWYVALGDEPLNSQMAALKQDGYTGLYTIETHFAPKGGSKMDGTRITLELLRERFKEEWA
ncbi:Sugar phosphate isomerase/epimerase [Paenibacillus sp. yr247]|uniref:sugar phosphate isomerase/epimerase family protein n=1 Tax=Paenibacillus sp. yr247 TaxID=1761880 RepID=UPI0008912701|nr:sugar phosphate isomerase/epimerase family protein [Paenibacillus sp. yr247]SDO37510.1 Sugar phosphate isomerase/epimerase [Paenibacillus sp. yr247]